jgi:hypothetical protein
MTSEPETQPTEPVEPEEPSRLAGGCVLAIAASAAGGIVYAVPEAGYFMAGLLATGTVRRARGWLDGRRAPADEDEETEEPDAEPVDIAEHLRTLGTGGRHVLLTTLAKEAGLPDTKAVRALLEEAGVRVRGVRGLKVDGQEGNGPGVHMADIPGAPLPAGAPPAERCLCSSAANANTNNAGGEGPREGFRVEPIGQAGTVVHDPAEAHRRQQVRTH